MKKWTCALAALVLGAGSFLSLPAPPAEAAASLFTVCGEAADGKKDTAVRDAQKKAVRKVLSQLMTEDNPQFATLLANYRSYVAEPQVFNKKSQGGKLLLFSKVPVDVDAIKDAIKSANEVKQERHSDQTAYFLVRVTGLPANGDDAKGQAQVVKTYNDTFSHLGFETGTLDAVFNALAPYRETPYDAFYQQMVQRVESGSDDFLSVTMAVIGEIAVTGKSHDANGFTREVSVRVDAYDVLAKKRIASYSDVYELWNKDPKLADQMLLDKAAVNSARAIADQTSTYWQKR